MTDRLFKVIDGFHYDTATAVKICTFQYGIPQKNSRYEETTLYRTPGGRFFLAGCGNPLSRWKPSTRTGPSSYGLIALTEEEARRFAEENGTEDIVARYFKPRAWRGYEHPKVSCTVISLDDRRNSKKR
ncbi:hypothetical protein [Pontitalea aquivivens]|uniref:hypothetical protein n=1 Tax=Pontitalea aquivivens TaxID=3388663 RepID=UPI003970DCB1